MADAALKSLYDRKIQKIAEQKALSDEMRAVLAKLNEASTLNRKNLRAAIAVSTQAGYFEYFTPSDEVIKAEKNKELNSLALRVSQTHRDLEQINQEIESHVRNKSKGPTEVHELPNLSAWFDRYKNLSKELAGKDNKASTSAATKKDMLTTFAPDPKIYGGTRHHRSFKSAAMRMKTGHCTR